MPLTAWRASTADLCWLPALLMPWKRGASPKGCIIRREPRSVWNVIVLAVGALETQEISHVKETSIVHERRNGGCARVRGACSGRAAWRQGRHAHLSRRKRMGIRVRIVQGSAL